MLAVEVFAEMLSTIAIGCHDDVAIDMPMLYIIDFVYFLFL